MPLHAQHVPFSEPHQNATDASLLGHEPIGLSGLQGLHIWTVRRDLAALAKCGCLQQWSHLATLFDNAPLGWAVSPPSSYTSSKAMMIHTLPDSSNVSPYQIARHPIFASCHCSKSQPFYAAAFDDPIRLALGLSSPWRPVP